MSQSRVIFFHDTETTGFPKEGDPFQEGQALCVQHAVKVIELDTRRVLGSMEFIIDHGVFIPGFLVDIHGVSQELAKQRGLTPERVMQTLHDLFLQSDRIVMAFNAEFDRKITQIMLDRTLGQGNHEWETAQHVCVMNAAKDWVKAPLSAAQQKKGMTGYKMPKLEEALVALCGRPHIGAHNAMNDVDAMIDVFYKMRELTAAGVQPEDYVPLTLEVVTNV